MAEVFNNPVIAEDEVATATKTEATRGTASPYLGKTAIEEDTPSSGNSDEGINRKRGGKVLLTNPSKQSGVMNHNTRLLCWISKHHDLCGTYNGFLRILAVSFTPVISCPTPHPPTPFCSKVGVIQGFKLACPYPYVSCTYAIPSPRLTSSRMPLSCNALWMSRMFSAQQKMEKMKGVADLLSYDLSSPSRMLLPNFHPTM